MTQTLAIFLDAYRNLNAKKMFWFVLAISLFVVGSFALVGINEKGVKVAIWQFDDPMMNAKFIPPALFYKFLFLQIGITWWLSWLATILALVSTAGMFPDLITSGSIDLLVSKPIGRLRLFLTEYAAGLLFVTLQVTIFCLASFLVIGFRGGVWEPGLFVAVPLMVIFFSYLSSVCVFLGIVTRSTVAALLLTLLFWFGVFGVGASERTLLMFVTMQQEGMDFSAMRHGPHGRDRFDDEPIVESSDDSASLPDAEADLQPTEETEPEKSSVRITRALGKSLRKAATESLKPEEERASADASAETDDRRNEEDESTTLKTAHKIVYGVKTVLPKTSETIELLERTLISLAELPEPPSDRPRQGMRLRRKLEETIRARSIAWVIGTSLVFEFAVLACAAWIFCRRDY